jgi:hypothetical protein
VSTGPAGGNGAFDALFAGLSADGSRVFFLTSEPLVVADTDANRDIYVSEIDTAPPETTIDSGPSGVTSSTISMFTFSSSEEGSNLECRLDAGAFAPCTSPSTTPALADGDHTFEVKATDVAGNTDVTPATRTWTIDTSATEVSSSVSLRFRKGAFSGRVTTSAPGDPDAAAACVADRKVRVKKIRRGPDRTVATVETNGQGRWRASGFKGAGGRYVALVVKEVREIAGATVICGSDKSERVLL